jgi:hypothetical protein
MKVHVTRINLAVELSMPQMQLLLDLDTMEVIKSLEDLGFYKVDYDGHFGAALFVTYDAQDKNMRQKLRHWVRKNLGSL